MHDVLKAHASVTWLEFFREMIISFNHTVVLSSNASNVAMQEAHTVMVA